MAARSSRLLVILGALAALLLVAVGGGLLFLDRLLLSAGRAQLATLSARTGRPITVEGIATTLRGGLGVRVTQVAVGPAQGEDRPLVVLRRAEVELDLWRALATRGHQLQIRQAVLDGLRVEVVRSPDGTTNVERLLKRLEETAGPKPAPDQKPADAAPAAPLDLSGLRVDRAALQDGRIAFLDLSRPGAGELLVEKLDLELRDLAAGRPLELKVAAAVLAPAQNLSLSLRAAPLPATLRPLLTRLTLRVEPVDLSPLLPFLPASVGLKAGRLRADLAAELGAAVEGGAGPTRVKGMVAANGLAFDAQQGGRPFDLSLEVDADGDAAAGDVRLGKLDLAVGPAGLSGKGRLVGLRGESPRAEEVELTARDLDLEALAALAPPLRRALGGATVAGPIGLKVRGGGSAGAQRITLAVDLTPVRLAVPGELAKAAGAPATLQATLDLAGGSRVRFDAALDLGGADLRPGGTLAKEPGDRLRLSARGTARSAGALSELAAESVVVELLGDRLAGRVSASSTRGAAGQASLRFDAEAQGDRLDLDRLLLPTPRPAGGAAPAPAPAPARPTSPKGYDPRSFAGLAGTATLKLGELRLDGVEARDVRLKLEVDEDQLTLTQARLAAFGGSVVADGSRAALARGGQPVDLKVALKGVAGRELLGLFSRYDLLDGRLDAKVELSGRGLSAKALLPSLSGNLGGLLAGGLFKGLDVAAAVTAPLAQRLPFVARAVESVAAKGTALGQSVPFSFTVADGTAHLARPLILDTGRGLLTLEGAVGLDGALDLPATLALSPEAVSALTLGKVRLGAPLPVAFRVVGPAWKPRVEGLALDAAVKTLAAAAAGAVLQRAGVDTTAVKQQAEAKVAEAEAEAKRVAEEQVKAARKKLEDEAKRKLKDLFQ